MIARISDSYLIKRGMNPFEVKKQITYFDTGMPNLHIRKGPRRRMIPLREIEYVEQVTNKDRLKLAQRKIWLAWSKREGFLRPVAFKDLITTILKQILHMFLGGWFDDKMSVEPIEIYVNQISEEINSRENANEEFTAESGRRGAKAGKQLADALRSIPHNKMYMGGRPWKLRSPMESNETLKQVVKNLFPGETTQHKRPTINLGEF